jgi:phosphohistidine phosphatase
MAHHQLWLLRHGEAVPHESKPDEQRELTARGERQSVAAGEALARLGLEFAACLTSPLVRARDTAKLACQALNVEPEEHDVLGKEFDAGAARELLLPYEDRDRILMVGHNPSFAQVVYDLTGARVDMKKGGVAAIRVGAGAPELLVLLRPKELEAMALAEAPHMPAAS